jgi:enoyl-CoA hydratase/carnithine racemase
MNDTEFASLTTQGDLIRLTLRRAPLNFLSREMLRQIQELLESLGDSPPCRFLVVDSGCAAFCAGLEMAEQTPESVFLLLDQYHTVAHTLSRFPRPTIALIEGMALGAGNELAACCDYALASLQAAFGQPEIKVGTMPSLAPLILPPRIGIQKTMHMILTGRPVDALEAERMGLIYKAVAPETMSGATEELLSSLRGSSIAIRAHGSPARAGKQPAGVPVPVSQRTDGSGGSGGRDPGFPGKTQPGMAASLAWIINEPEIKRQFWTRKNADERRPIGLGRRAEAFAAPQAPALCAGRAYPRSILLLFTGGQFLLHE